MTEQEFKEKIIRIVLDVPITGIKIREILGGEATANAIADALISAGIGDVSERKNDGFDACIYGLQGLVEEYKHRAKVMEKALDKAVKLAYEIRTSLDTLSCSSCPMFDYGIFDECKKKGLYFNCEQRWKDELLKQSEKELQEEIKND